MIGFPNEISKELDLKSAKKLKTFDRTFKNLIRTTTEEFYFCSFFNFFNFFNFLKK